LGATVNLGPNTYLAANDPAKPGDPRMVKILNCSPQSKIGSRHEQQEVGAAADVRDGLGEPGVLTLIVLRAVDHERRHEAAMSYRVSSSVSVDIFLLKRSRVHFPIRDNRGIELGKEPQAVVTGLFAVP